MQTEEQWTKSLIAEYVRVQTKGVDGDMPLPAGFCREYRFWRVMFYTGIISCLMGLLAAGFLNIADKVSGALFFDRSLSCDVDSEILVWFR